MLAGNFYRCKFTGLSLPLAFSEGSDMTILGIALLQLIYQLGIGLAVALIVKYWF